MKKLGLLMLAVMMISLSSCGGDNAEKAKSTAGEAVEATKEAATEAATEAEEAVKDAAEKTEDAATEAADTAKEAVTEAADAAKEAVADVDGKTLFMQNGCIACHNVDKKTVGPKKLELLMLIKKQI